MKINKKKIEELNRMKKELDLIREEIEKRQEEAHYHFIGDTLSKIQSLINHYRSEISQ